MVAGVVVSLPVAPLGWRITFLVILYAVMMVGASVYWQPDWLRILKLVMPLSVFQVLPDWFLSQELEILVFPQTGGPRVGTVPAFMAGLWTIPLFLCVFVAEEVARRLSSTEETRWRVSVAVAAAVALVLFAASEASLWALPIWFAKGVSTVGPMAVYVVPPEVLLGAATFVAYRATRGRSWWMIVGSAGVVSTLYTGALALSYLLIERVR
jgi:hypothetical protein